MGRLAWEIARMGYAVEMNECSPLVALAAHAVMSRTSTPELLHPWAHLHRNLRHGDARDLLETAAVPNPLPALASQQAAAPVAVRVGDFHRLYPADSANPEGRFDAVVASYFLDKAGDDALDTMLRMDGVLREGGVLVNAGPVDWKHGAEPLLSSDDLALFWSSRGFSKLHRGEVGADYSRRPGATLAQEGHGVAVLAMRKRGGG
ncbi:N2227-like protein [Hyaloraphidium curvatum]|nr:N2227-like protein [Hyaloraphidium curvatum]